MRSTKPLMIGLIVACSATGAPPALAQEPYRVRGTLKAVAGDQLLVSSREGEVMGFQLDPELGIFAVTPARIDDIKQGDFVGLTSIEAGGRRVALEAHLFAEDLRGLGEGHYPWDLVQEPNMMTNATIAEVEEVGADRQIEVSYREGEAKVEGAQTIYLAPEVPIVRLARSDDRALLQAGKEVVLIVRPERDLTPVVIAVVVGDGGAQPPM